MRLAGSLQLALLLALTSRAAGLNIPLEGRTVMILIKVYLNSTSLINLKSGFTRFD